MEIYIRAQLFLCILISITYDTESIHHGILWKYYENITASSSAGVKSYKFSLSKENINFSSSTQLMTYHIQTFNISIAVKLRRLEQKDRNDAFHKVILENRHQENLTCYWSMSSANAKAIFSNCKNQLFAIVNESMGQDTYLIEPVMTSKGVDHVAYKISRGKDPCISLYETSPIDAGIVHRRKRLSRSISESPKMEVLVVADESMANFHGKSIRKYILTIMAEVRKIFQHSSLGVRVDLVVSDLVILTGEEENLQVSRNSDTTMRSFCEWQSEQFDRDGTDHDVALLLTRLNICSDQDHPCNTVGMAYISGMCQSRRRCSIAEDSGLDVALTVAHELGHNLGMRHDGYGNECAEQTRDIPHVMSSTTLKASQRGLSQWSKCSKRKIHYFLSTSNSWCLRETQSKRTIPLPKDLPGVTFTADEQCRHQYGNLATQCRRYQVRLCRELWCEIEGEYFCRTRLNPAAYGTKCGEGKWCMYGNCVYNKSVLVKKDGGWSSWGGWSECSRSCGTGVSTRYRRCNNPRPKNGGRFCQGKRERHILCNQHACPTDSKEIRREQCESYNGQMYNDMFYNWKPLLSKHKPCALYCTPTTEERFSVRFSSKVIDGTPCMPGGTDLCVNGKCRRVGCDNKIGSNAKEDICGVCKGNGSTCRKVEGHFNQLSGSGYVEVAVIPVGARNVQVMETKPCTSFLALKGRYDTYYVNGNWKIQLPGQVDVEGTKVIYDRKGTWERLIAKGPTTEPMHVMVLYHGYNLGIKYKYSMPLPNQTHDRSAEDKQTSGTRKINYGWIRRGWQKCSVVCGTGIQKSSREECVRFLNGKIEIANERYCRGATKPRQDIRVCNEHPCPIWWSVTRWSKCSHNCGSGRQHRQVFCMRQAPNGSIQKTSTHMCTKDKPSSKQNCYLRSCSVKWRTKPWTKCYTICGKGYRYREVYCPLKDLCDSASKPARKKTCYGESCFSWRAEDWSNCSRSCGYGYRLRRVTCEHKLSKKQGTQCNRSRKPSVIQLCLNRYCN